VYFWWSWALRLLKKRLRRNMIQAGYMYKQIVLPEGWNCLHVTKIYSVSHCISKDFADYIPFWKHNKYWFFNNPEDMAIIIKEQKISDEFELLFYELYEKEFDEGEGVWQDFTVEESFGYQVTAPVQREFLGFDIVSYSLGTSHQCSPLSCNGLCQDVEVNEYCLLDDFDHAIRLTETLNTSKAEPGPYRIIAVHRVSTVA
jgi:hypothetical protein